MANPNPNPNANANPNQDEEYAPDVDPAVFAARPDLYKEVQHFIAPRPGIPSISSANAVRIVVLEPNAAGVLEVGSPPTSCPPSSP